MALIHIWTESRLLSRATYMSSGGEGTDDEIQHQKAHKNLERSSDPRSVRAYHMRLRHCDGHLKLRTFVMALIRIHIVSINATLVLHAQKTGWRAVPTVDALSMHSTPCSPNLF